MGAFLRAKGWALVEFLIEQSNHPQGWIWAAAVIGFLHPRGGGSQGQALSQPGRGNGAWGWGSGAQSRGPHKPPGKVSSRTRGRQADRAVWTIAPIPSLVTRWVESVPRIRVKGTGVGCMPGLPRAWLCCRSSVCINLVITSSLLPWTELRLPTNSHVGAFTLKVCIWR